MSFNRHNVSFGALASSGVLLGGSYGKISPSAAPENPPPSGGTDQEFADTAKGQVETFSSTAYTDPDLVSEGTALKARAPRSAARWVFIGQGATASATDPNNWWDDTLKVRSVPNVTGETALVPQGQTILFDWAAGSAPDLKWFRVDGECEIDTTANRTIPFSFVFVDWTGHFKCGSLLSPVPASTKIRFAPYDCNTDMDIVADPMMLGRGFVVFDGACDIFGASKQAWMRAVGTPGAGNFTVTGDRAADGWEAGDIIQLTGTQFGGYVSSGLEGWQSETGEILSINNSNPAQPIITVTAPWTYDHAPCFLNSQLTCHIANLTRNVLFDPPDAQNPEIWQRPHNMFKGEGTINVFHVQVRRYGRSNHNEPQTLARDANYPIGSVQWNGEPWNGPTFMAGAFGEIAYTPVSGTIKIGNTFTTTSGGAGVVVEARDNILYIESYDTTGGPLANGDTITFSNGATATATADGILYAITTRTVLDGRYSLHAHRCGHKNPLTPAVTFFGCVVEDTESWAYVHHDSHADFTWCIATGHRSAGFAAEGGGSFGTWGWCLADACKDAWKPYNEADTKNGGLSRGSYGHGFWFNSRLVHMQFCVSSNNQCGALWTSRISSAQNTSPYPSATDRPGLFYGLADYPEISVSKAFARIEGFLSNEIYCSSFGLAVAKKQPLQHHWGRSFLDGCTIWEVDTGVAQQYTGGYTLNNFTIYAFDTSKRNGQAPFNPERAFSVFRQAVDVVIRNATVYNFPTGIEYTLNGGTNFLENLGHRVVNFTAVNVGTKYVATGGSGGILDLENTPWDPNGNGIVNASYLTTAQEGPGLADSITFNWQSKEDECYWTGGDYLVLGSYTDSLGVQNAVLGQRSDATLTDLQSEKPNGQQTKTAGFLVLLTQAMIEAQFATHGYWTRTNGEVVLLVYHHIQDRGTGEWTIVKLPIAIRAAQSYIDGLGATNNGAIEGQFGGEFDTFTPAGTPGPT